MKLHERAIDISIMSCDSLTIHYDLYQTSEESINILLYEALVLKTLRNAESRIIMLPSKITFYIEICFNLN